MSSKIYRYYLRIPVIKKQMAKGAQYCPVEIKNHTLLIKIPIICTKNSHFFYVLNIYISIT